MNKKSCLQKIREEFSGLKWKKHRFLTHGWDHVIVILDDKIVFRFPKEVSRELRDELYDETRLLKYLINKVQVGIPKYEYVSNNKSFAGYRILGGRELTSTYYKKLPTSDKERVARQLADFLTTLHATPKSVITKYNIRREDSRKEHNGLVRDTRKYLSPRLNKKENLAIEQFLLDLKATFKHDYSEVLVHNDLIWEHILWNDKNKQVNIIDFSDRSVGDPAIDFAGLWEYGRKLTNRVYELYQGKKDDGLLHRSQLYSKRIPLYVMKGVIDGYPSTFKEGHQMFRERFKQYLN